MSIRKQWLKNNTNNIFTLLYENGNCFYNRERLDDFIKTHDVPYGVGPIRPGDVNTIICWQCPHIMHVRTNHPDIHAWLFENCQQRYVYKPDSYSLSKGNCHKIFFEYKKDALLFKMTFQIL